MCEWEGAKSNGEITGRVFFFWTIFLISAHWNVSSSRRHYTIPPLLATSLGSWVREEHSIPQRPFHVSLRCSRFSQSVHWPCLDCDTSFAHLAASAVGSQQPPTFSSGLLLPCGSACSDSESASPMLHLSSNFTCLRADFSCCTASDGIYFLPIANVGAAIGRIVAPTLGACHAETRSESCSASL